MLAEALTFKPGDLEQPVLPEAASLALPTDAHGFEFLTAAAASAGWIFARIVCAQAKDDVMPSGGHGHVTAPIRLR